MMVSLATQEAEPVVTSVLGLRSEDKKAGERLTTSLRAAFAEREMAGGQELTLEEVILTLDCASEEDTVCMTEAGSALETEKLVYGVLNTSGGGYVIEISVLDVTTGQVEAQGSLAFDKAALSASNVDATATEVVNSLYPQADTSVVAATPTNENDDVPAVPEEMGPEPESNYIWGPYKPRPTWKKAGLGISAVVAVGGIVVGSIGWSMRKKPRQEVSARIAEIGTMPDNPLHNLVGETQTAFCREAVKDEDSGRRRLFLSTNSADPESGSVCQGFLNARGMWIGGTATAIVGGAATAIFTVLFFVHKKQKRSPDARKPTFRISGAPTQGGAMFGGYGRF